MAAAQDLLEGEMSQVEIAEKHGVTPSAISKWKSTLEEEGIEGLKTTNDDGNQGPGSELDEQDREQLVELLEEGTQVHTAGRLIFGLPSVNSRLTSLHATARGFDWRKVSAISAVALWLGEDNALRTKVFFRLHPDENMTSNLIRDFLHQVRLQMDGQMTVLWDRASVHTANRIERFFERYDRMDEIRLPTACPELNPCEGVWDWSKLNDMGNVTPQSFDELISRTVMPKSFFMEILTIPEQSNC